MSKNNKFASYMKNRRKQLGLTQKYLAELSQISEPTIKTYEKGNRKPKPGQLLKLAFALRVSPDELLQIVEPEYKGCINRDNGEIISFLDYVGTIITIKRAFGSDKDTYTIKINTKQDKEKIYEISHQQFELIETLTNLMICNLIENVGKEITVDYEAEDIELEPFE